jgi:hypothetical protein
VKKFTTKGKGFGKPGKEIVSVTVRGDNELFPLAEMATVQIREGAEGLHWLSFELNTADGGTYEGLYLPYMYNGELRGDILFGMGDRIFPWYTKAYVKRLREKLHARMRAEGRTVVRRDEYPSGSAPSCLDRRTGSERYLFLPTRR